MTRLSPRTSPSTRRLPLSPLPWLLLTLCLTTLLPAAYWAQARLQVPQAPAAPPACCTVRWQLRGEAAPPARLQVLEWPAALDLPPSARELPLSAATPAELPLPGPGLYRMRVFADGYAPQTVTVAVPRSEAVVIELGE